MALILASTSTIRNAMLNVAGVSFQALAPEVDEAAVKAAMPAEAIALELARKLGGLRG